MIRISQEANQGCQELKSKSTMAIELLLTHTTCYCIFTA